MDASFSQQHWFLLDFLRSFSLFHSIAAKHNYSPVPPLLKMQSSKLSLPLPIWHVNFAFTPEEAAHYCDDFHWLLTIDTNLHQHKENTDLDIKGTIICLAIHLNMKSTHLQNWYKALISFCSCLQSVPGVSTCVVYLWTRFWQQSFASSVHSSVWEQRWNSPHAGKTRRDLWLPNIKVCGLKCLLKCKTGFSFTEVRSLVVLCA